MSTLFSFNLVQNKESISVSAVLTDTGYDITVALEGRPYSRIFLVPDALVEHHAKDGSFTFTRDKDSDKCVFVWGVDASSFYDNRRITVDLKELTLTVEFWGYAPPPDNHGYNLLLSHNMKAAPAPSYKLYKHRGVLRAKLL